MRMPSTAHGGRGVRAATALGILAGLVAVTGCSDGTGAAADRPRESATTHQGSAAGQTPPPVPGTPVLLGVRSLVLPIEPYLFTNRQMTGILRARQALVTPCMRRFGIDWPASGPKPDAGTAAAPGMKNAANMSRRYGITDPADAARHGYHLVPDARQRTTKDPSARPPDADTLAVLTGRTAEGAPGPARHHGRAIPEGGCQGQATARISGGPQRLGNDQLASEINVVSYQRSTTDPRVTSVFRAWSACMRERGYSYAAPTEAPGKDPRFTGPEPTRAEIALARADVACKRDTNVIGVWFTVDAAYQRQMMASKAQELARARNVIRTQTATAERLLNDGP
ncbi:hypothetical protein OHT57_06780 [Streptomyces sp. NBC_00285]|uniref:hypothetical protein n=1 Tax=Streptomyces sp. NBC_00285 TaxID=2975700 RepID=UPI002E2A227D|nr:hypothetical protein [Streptomyces sp. NBC_00285]